MFYSNPFSACDSNNNCIIKSFSFSILLMFLILINNSGCSDKEKSKTAPKIISVVSATATVDIPYSYTITVTGYPTPTITVSGLPSWLSFNPSNQTISGTPGASDVGTTGTITVSASNGVLPNATQLFTITIRIPPSIISTAPTTATVGIFYSYLVIATGNPLPIVYTSSQLPVWLTYDSETKIFSGTPTSSDVGTTGSILITAWNDVSPVATQTFIIDVRIALTITSIAPTTATVGLPYSYSIMATGDPNPSLSVSGLPTWLVFDGVETISGTPEIGDVGLSGIITVTASNGIAPDSVQTFTIDVYIAPTITSTPSTTATVGIIFSYSLTTTGNPLPTVSVSGLPAWLSYNSGTQTISGTPTTSGMTGMITVNTSNGVGSDATQTFTINVLQPPSITSTAVRTAAVGTAYSYVITALGTPMPTVTVSGLPSWLSYNSGTQTVSGTPTVSSTSSTITVTASNGIEPNAVQTFTITVIDWELSLYGLYVIIDLQSPYTISNLSSVPDLLTNDEYKTTKLVLRRIMAGTFQMGGSLTDASPIHSVSITKDFYIGVFEVTQRQWYEVMGSWPPSQFTTNRDKRPVEKVSWNFIMGGSGFTYILSGLSGLSFDLPTEAEWEYCCKAGTTTNYSYGNSTDDAYMWYEDNNSPSDTKEVGTRLPNPWGLYDMHGNVLEWCHDWYSSTSMNPPSFYQSCFDQGTVSDPMGPTTGLYRVTRGGSWDYPLWMCWSFYREWYYSPHSAANNIGLRVVAIRRN